MHRATTGRGRSGGGVFAKVPQTDGDEGHGPSHERRTPTQFRRQVQSILRQGNPGGGPGTEGLHSSPALSDTTLISGDYLEVHDDGHPEVDIGDYAEYGGYYGPRATNASLTKSLRAGLGIEVRPGTEASDGLCVDDPSTSISYKGSEGNVEERVPCDAPNYRPPVLRKRFLFALIAALVVLLSLTELAVHLFPDASKTPSAADGRDSTPELLHSPSSRKGSAGDDGSAGVLLQGRQNEHPVGNDDTNSPSPVPPTEETPAIPTESPDTTPPTVVQPPQETRMTRTSNAPSTQITETSAEQQPTVPATTETTTAADLPTAPEAPTTTTDVPTIPKNPPPTPSDTSNPGTTTTVEPIAPLPTETTTEAPDAPTSNTEVEAPSTSAPKPSPEEPTLTDTQTSQQPPAPTSKVPSTQEPTKTGDHQPPDTPETSPPPGTSQPTKILEPPSDPEPTTSAETTNSAPPVATQEPETTTTEKTETKPPVETQTPPHTENPPDKPPEPTTSVRTTDSPPPAETEKPENTTKDSTVPKPPVETQPPPHTDQPPEPTSTTENTAIPSKEPELSILPVDAPGTSRTPTDSPAKPTESPGPSDQHPAQPQPTEPQLTETEQPPKPTQGGPSQGPPSEGQPTTQQPTSEQPTQGKPTADQPTTAQPSPEQPTSERPSTQQPTTGQPTTEQPTTQAPPTRGPTRESPTEGPTTQQPSTQAPPTQGPIQEPPTEGPPAQGSTTQPPASEQTATEKPTTDRPTTEQPTSEHPTQGHPTPDQPAHEQPTEGQPTEGQHTEGQPTEGQPTQGQPSQEQPTQGLPTPGPSTTTGPIIAQPTTFIAPVPSSSSEAEGGLEPSSSPRPPGTSIPSTDGPGTGPPSSENPTSDPSGPSIPITLTLSSTGTVSKEQSSPAKPPSPPETTTAAEASETGEAGAVSVTKTSTRDADSPSDPEPFTTLVLTEDTSTNAHPEVPALEAPTSDDDDDYSRVATTTSMTHEIDFGHRLIQSALTLYTPTEVGGGKATPIWAYRTFTTTVETDTDGRPTKTETWALLYQAQKTILTDYQGRPTRTLTYYAVPYETTLHDRLGHPTATTTTDVAQAPTTRTLRDENGIATRTITEMVPISSTTVLVVTATPANTADPGGVGGVDPESAMRVSDAQYFLVLVFPTLAAIALAIPVRILNRTAKLYQPFHAMTSHSGAPASESLCLDTTGPRSLLVGIRSASRGHALPSLTGALVLASAVLIPLSGDVARLRLEGPGCVVGNGTATDCATAVAIRPNTARAVIGILAFMLALTCIVAAVLRRWRTGVVQSRSFRPWSLHHMAHLGTNPDIRLLLGRLRKGKKITADGTLRRFGGRSFVLDYWKDNGVLKYGILISSEAGQPLRRGRVESVTFVSRGSRGHGMPFFLLTFPGRAMLLSFLCAALIFVLVYNITGERRAGTIVTGESLGLRVLFAATGVSLAFVWDSFFYCKSGPVLLCRRCVHANASTAVASMSPFRLLNRRNQHYAQEAIQTAPPTSVFSGAASTLRRRRRDLYLGVVAAAGVFAELLPLLLSNVPFEARRSYPGFEPCTWISIIILCLMILVVVGSFLVRWPHMPIDPTSLAGLLYYALDPEISSSVTGRSPSGGALFGRVDAPDV
ncbi:hypothetical protein DL763_005142 [Monosporascus cannonballus]|nr:hypothetical protein DL763_005142 [Monosporascus cannonballus]